MAAGACHELEKPGRLLLTLDAVGDEDDGMADATIWGIHGGRTGDADTLFKNKNVIAIGWAKAGDLSNLGNDREAFKALVAKTWPEKAGKAMSVATAAGQLYRFVQARARPKALALDKTAWHAVLRAGPSQLHLAVHCSVRLWQRFGN